MSTTQSMSPPNPPTPAFGMPSVPQAQQMPPEFQAALVAAQNSLPPWARWIFAVCAGPLLLTTYNGVKDIWGVPEAQKGIVIQLKKHDESLDDLNKKVDGVIVSVDRIADRLDYLSYKPQPAAPSTQATSQPRKPR